MGNRVMGNRVMGNRVLGNRVLGNRVLGNRVLGNRVMGNRVLGNRVMGIWNIRGPIQGSPLGDPGMGSRGGQLGTPAISVPCVIVFFFLPHCHRSQHQHQQLQ